jgi:hypothetical protein
MRYQAINAKCSDGYVALVRDTADAFQYTLHKDMREAEAEAEHANEEVLLSMARLEAADDVELDAECAALINL